MKPVDCHALYEDAEFYDLEFGQRDVEIPFYCAQSEQTGGPVLEIGCGTGRLTIPIARKGIEIIGLDVSRTMLEQARRNSIDADVRVEWIEQDCRQMHLNKTVTLAFSATNAMQHLLDPESILAFLRSARRVVKLDGWLILDVFNPNPAKLARTMDVRYIHKIMRTSRGSEIRVEIASEYDSDTQVLRFDLFYLGDGMQLRTKHVNMRCFFPEELLALCRWTGWEVVRRFGDYDESPFAKGSPKQILVCRNGTNNSPCESGAFIP